jgi:hypothetical protein
MHSHRFSPRAAVVVGLAVAVSLGTLAGCGSSPHASATATKKAANTVAIIKPGTKPHNVDLNKACAKAVAPVEAMIHSMHSGAVRTPAENKILNKVLLTAPKACSTAAEIRKGQVSAQYRAWQYQDLLPWMQMPPTHQVVAAAHSTTSTQPKAKARQPKHHSKP